MSEISEITSVQNDNKQHDYLNEELRWLDEEEKKLMMSIARLDLKKEGSVYQKLQSEEAKLL